MESAWWLMIERTLGPGKILDLIELCGIARSPTGFRWCGCWVVPGRADIPGGEITGHSPKGKIAVVGLPVKIIKFTGRPRLPRLGIPPYLVRWYSCHAPYCSPQRKGRVPRVLAPTGSSTPTNRHQPRSILCRCILEPHRRRKVSLGLS